MCAFIAYLFVVLYSNVEQQAFRLTQWAFLFLQSSVIQFPFMFCELCLSKKLCGDLISRIICPEIFREIDENEKFLSLSYNEGEVGSRKVMFLQPYSKSIVRTTVSVNKTINTTIWGMLALSNFLIFVALLTCTNVYNIKCYQSPGHSKYLQKYFH